MIKINDETVIIPEIETEKENLTKIVVKTLLHHRRATMSAVVHKFSLRYPELATSTQNFSNKLARNSILFNDLVKFAEVAGYNLYFSADDPVRKTKVDNTFATQSLIDCVIIDGVNFDKIVFAGKDAKPASEYVKTKLSPDIACQDEIVMLHNLPSMYDVMAKPSGTKTNNHNEIE